jgi:hypothetical protein
MQVADEGVGTTWTDVRLWGSDQEIEVSEPDSFRDPVSANH